MWFHDITQCQGINVPSSLVTARQPITIINYVVETVNISSLSGVRTNLSLTVDTFKNFGEVMTGDRSVVRDMLKEFWRRWVIWRC